MASARGSLTRALSSLFVSLEAFAEERGRWRVLRKGLQEYQTLDDLLLPACMVASTLSERRTQYYILPWMKTERFKCLISRYNNLNSLWLARLEKAFSFL